MEHLLSAWPKVAKQLRDAKRILLLTDYDGTLTPIVERPERATLPADVRRLLRALAGQRRLTLGIISGRALADIKEMIGIQDIIYAGNHGLEIEGPGISFTSPLAEESKAVIRLMHYLLNQALGAIKGVRVEDKGLTLSVHYRQVADDKSAEVRDVFDRVVGGAATMGKIRITSGKKVYEIRPAVAWDKGKVVKMLMRKYGRGGRKSGLWPIYLGDDLTDEDGFKAIKNYGSGIAVFVGEGEQRGAARYFLKSPKEVAKLLSLMLEEAQLN